METINYIWDEYLNDSSLTARIFRNGKYIKNGTGFVKQNDSLSMSLTWSNGSGGFLKNLESQIVANIDTARDNIKTINQFTDLFRNDSSSKSSNGHLAEQVTMSSAELFKSFKGYAFDTDPVVSIIFLTDDEDSNARDKCYEFVNNFIPWIGDETKLGTFFWTVRSNESEQKLEFKGSNITITNGFSLVMGGVYNSPESNPSDSSQNGSRVYSNMVVTNIQVEKSTTLVKIGTANYAPLFYKVDVTFTPAATLAPKKFLDMI